MKFKSIDSLSITECCEQLNLRREDLPEALLNLNEPTEREQLLITQLELLLDEDKAAVESCSTIKQYEGYLSTWVDGLYHGYAQTRIAQLKAEAEEFAYYTNNKGSISGCEAYLQKYPQGNFVKEVQSLLDQKRKKTRNVIILILLLIAVGIFANSNFNVKGNTPAEGPATHLGVSTESVSFSYNGGSSTITVSTDGEWEISTGTADWGHTSISGNTITLRVDENDGDYRTDYFVIKSGTYEKRINISQAGKSATHLDVSTESASFSYNGGSSTITVSTDGEWEISTGTADWGHTSISGNTITLRVDENTSANSRTDYFVVKSGSKEKRINISQDGKPVTRLSVSTENVSFSKDGGRRSITVSTNGEWEIGVGTASWAHTSISGNTITLRVDENDSGDERTDYFTVVAGDKNVRINITQAGGPSAEVNSIRVEHNIMRTGYNSVMGPWGWQQVPYTYNVMRIYVDFEVHNMKGKTIRVCAFFYDEDGDEITTSNNQFRAPDGQVTVQRNANSAYESTEWSDFVLEIPYGVMRKGDNKFHIQILDNRGNTLTTSSYEYFSVN